MYVGALASLLEACDPDADREREARVPLLLAVPFRRSGAFDPVDEVMVICESDANVVKEGARSWVGA